jgi:hypothetical protein
MKNSKHYQIDCSIKCFAVLVLACGMFMVSGCASVVSGMHQNVQITSQPDAASVKVEQLHMTNNIVIWEGKTPAEVKLSRRGSYLVTVSQPGYQNAQISVADNGLNGWVFGNILIGGLIGVTIDLISGAVNHLEPGTIHVNWADTNSPPTVTEPGITPPTPNKPISKK